MTFNKDAVIAIRQELANRAGHDGLDFRAVQMFDACLDEIAALREDITIKHYELENLRKAMTPEDHDRFIEQNRDIADLCVLLIEAQEASEANDDKSPDDE